MTWLVTVDGFSLSATFYITGLKMTFCVGGAALFFGVFSMAEGPPSTLDKFGRLSSVLLIATLP